MYKYIYIYIYIYYQNPLKAYRLSELIFFILKVDNIRCFILFVYNPSMFLFNSTIRFVPCAFFINKQFRTCTNAFPNEFTVRSYEYCAGKHMILYWIQENKTATYFLRSRLFTYDIMKNFNCNFSTCKHNLVSFSAESYFNSRIASLFFYIFFFFRKKR
jgi:hypothetical protein